MILLVLLMLIVPGVAEAACSGASPNWTATTEADVIACHASAVAGDTITVAAGSETWSAVPTFTKAIALVGAGIGSSIVTFTGDGGFLWTTPASGNVRLTGFTFRQLTDGCSQFDGVTSSIKMRGSNHNMRVHHNRFEASRCNFIHITDDVVGVVDHNQIDNNTSLGHPLIIEHRTWGGIGDTGDNSWAQASTIGTVNAVYVEDNTFTNTSGLNGIFQTDDFKGARTVYRFNTWVDSVWSSHGTESGGRFRGFRHVEMYRNQFNWSRGAIESLGGLRGGTGMMFDNDVNNTGPTQIFAFNTFRRTFNVSGVGQYVWGGCGQQVNILSITRSSTTATVTTNAEHFIHPSGSWVTISGGTAPFNGTFIASRVNATQFTYTVSNSGDTTSGGTPVKASPFDGNTDSTGYPCLDQLGRGRGQYYAGYEPNIITPVAAASQDPEPAYCWYNKVNSVQSNCVAVSATDVIIGNRDYYNWNTAFNGTTQRGIGRGLRGDRPVQCNPGDAYWSLDQGIWNTSTTETYSDAPGDDGVLDRCTGPNTWSNGWYTPFTYPHPLIGGSSSSIASAVITSPLTGSTQAAGSVFSVSGTALAGNGALTRVDVYINSILACSDTVASFSPWGCSVTAPSSSGVHTLTARATDADGQGPSSAGVPFIVPSGTSIRATGKLNLGGKASLR